MMTNGQANETAEVPNAIFSKVVFESNQIVRELLENNGVLTPQLKTFCTLKEVVLPGMADPYGYLLSRLQCEIDYWGMRDPDRMEPSLSKIFEDLISRITISMIKIKLNELKGETYIFHLSESGILEWGIIKNKGEKKNG